MWSFSGKSLLAIALSVAVSYFSFNLKISKTVMQKHVLKSSELGDFVADLIADAAQQSVKEKGVFTLGVSGGSIINMIADKLTKKEIEWEKWRIFFCDERLVPFSDSESTYGQYKRKVVDQIGFADSWIPIDPGLNLNDCANDYQDKVHKVFGSNDVPSFDMLLLGMGPDGHTCSLFPDHPLLQETKLHIAPISDSPKPPPSRVTMTLPVLNAARNAVFISAGASKASTIKMVHDPSSTLPASLVKPVNGNLIWVMDDAAASHL